MEKYKGVIIEESLENKKVFGRVKIISTKVEEVTPKHRTPWLQTWTLHTVEIETKNVNEVVGELSKDLDPGHSWYADFDNGTDHYIIYCDKIFHVDMKNKEEYDVARNYGISIGIPPYQVDFHPLEEKWKRE